VAGGVTAEWIGWLACGGEAPMQLVNYQTPHAHGDGMSVSGGIR
jgi:hypothetical protein